MDTRTDDFVGEVEVRSEDNEEIKSVELLAHDFKINDGTREVAFVDDDVRDRVLAEVEAAILKTVWHEVHAPDGAAPLA